MDFNKIAVETVSKGKDIYFKITNAQKMRPFFMSIVSDSDHWMFISSNGGVTAGRKNADFSLFPYYTEDKVTEFNEVTGSKTIVKARLDNTIKIWEPFSIRNCFSSEIIQNIYKSEYGNAIVFEEINTALNLKFSYKWENSDEFGFVKTSLIENLSENEVEIDILDGIQNVLPANVGSDLQRASSNLVDAYKRTELDVNSGLGIFALSAVIVDKAEPSEALNANVVWSYGLDNTKILLSSLQLDAFRNNLKVVQEEDVKGEKGAYFNVSNFKLKPKEQKGWSFIADLNYNHSKVFTLIQKLSDKNKLFNEVLESIKEGKNNLLRLTSASDSTQKSSDFFKDTRHYSNTLFNIMRGGIFDMNYTIEKHDFISYIRNANKEVFEKNKSTLGKLDTTFSYQFLSNFVETSNDLDLYRLSKEYLPLKFSRRHGDPSRPWNKFSINIKSESDGSKILDYEGNWRDIFQNWEALAYSYPNFLEGMIYKFLNASTFDGYNPYRVTKDGFDWETIEKDDPWSYIGYWGDHQIIYLQKFLELAEMFFPDLLSKLLINDSFVYAAVPYKIKSFNDILENPKDTIIFDHQWDTKIRQKRENLGSDGALLLDEKNQIYKVNFLEKILATVLAKLSNFVPEGGIWMNTQRPEWNDANNALVGNGISMVTLCYLRRFLKLFNEVIEKSNENEFKISNELVEFYHAVRKTFYDFEPVLANSFSNSERFNMLNNLGKAASDYRDYIYNNGFWGKKRSISKVELSKFVSTTLSFIDHTIKSNKRTDNLYHAYNLLQIENQEIKLSYLSEMLEGQVAVLSSGLLKPEESLDVLKALKSSKLFREDQYSYLLYPNKKLPGFLQRNTISKEDVNNSKLLKSLIEDDNKDIINVDVFGNYHFNSKFKNVNFLKDALNNLPNNYQNLVAQEFELLENIYENVFKHRQFTGRSGTFYAYEGLGSIYWHMVSKLLLATTECAVDAIEHNTNPKIIGEILDHYYEIQAGIGTHKSPELYGAFPTDPYSHTPWHKGAQQPGMTGQVKEDIISRWLELGVIIKNGILQFKPKFLRIVDLLQSNDKVVYYDVNGIEQMMSLNKNEFFFTYCQVPIIYALSNSNNIEITFSNGKNKIFDNTILDIEISQMIFDRSNEVKQVKVYLTKDNFKE